MPSAESIARTLRAGFATPPPDSRVMMRWWWFGPFVEEAELARELEAMSAAGIGGVEVCSTYPLSTSEAGRAPEGFLSERFLSRLRFAAETASRLGLRFDVTIGSRWSFGGPHITDETAARRLRWDAREVPPRAARIFVAQPWPGDRLVAAYIGDGSLQEPPAQRRQLPVRDDAVEVPQGSGPRTVLLAVSSPTGQNVKRASLGAEGPVLDHLSRAATEAHLRAVADPILAAVPGELVTAVFCDSLEVYGADWTPALPREFRARRGYDLLAELPLLHTRGEGCERVRADVAATLGELYEENFVAVVHEWAQRHGALFRIQSYGQPPGTLSAYRHADLPEGEGWGWRSVTQTKWATSAAHLYQRPVVSSETWTWVHSPSLAATPLDLVGEAHEHLLLGVNQLIGHGWPYSPPTAQPPGWIFYAAGALSDVNPWWPAMPALTGYLHRLCWLLRQGHPVVDVALYAPSRDAAQRFEPSTRGHLDLWHSTRAHIGEALPAALREAGYDYDLVDDTALGEADWSRYRVVVLPFVRDLPAETARRLEQHAAAGGAVVTVGGAVQRDGWIAVDDVDALLPALGALVSPDAPTSPATPDVGVVHRRAGDVDVYFVANTGPHPQSFTLRPRDDAAAFERWDARTGRAHRVEVAGGGVPLDLQPYEAAVVVALPTPDDDVPAAPPVRPADTMELAGPWTVAYADSPLARGEVALPHRWEDDPGRADCSGAATYETTVTVDGDRLDGRIVLDFGPARADAHDVRGESGLRGASYRAEVTAPVGEVAQVVVNGVGYGCAWAPPYAVDVTDAVRAGENTVAVRVLNTGLGALRANTELAATVDAATATYGKRFTMQDLGLAHRPTVSGLRSVPSLRFQQE
ncbi:glycosyl hydrolase [Pseudonocardia nigra]|uniref:glycosyl hydrolase n=1 Tax=Pseudonocardia nigra TaxID=1921578 RepID=UPI001C5DBD75|nr:glycosyl hydrolase [Pseudonocardia nigra]